MTKEQAIKILKVCRERKLKYTHYALDEYKAATDMAIQALEQQPCEDCISRSEAIRIASGYCHWANVADELKKLPSVQPKAEFCEDCINRKAAIDAIKELCNYYTPTKSVTHPHMDFVIDELEALPPVTPQPKTEQEHCKDAISRKTAIDAIGNVQDYDDGMVWEALSHAQRDIAILPSVSTEKTGRWITDRCDMYICSKCNHTYTDLSGERYGMNFCPNCGAKMVDPQESEV